MSHAMQEVQYWMVPREIPLHAERAERYREVQDSLDPAQKLRLAREAEKLKLATANS